MDNLYYKIWSDAILSFKKHHPDRKIALWLLITWINALNLWTIVVWLKFFEILSFPQIDVDMFPGEMLDGFLSFAVVFALPVGVLNYFFVFHNNRYESFIDEYKGNSSKYALRYSFSALGLAFISLVVYGLLTEQY